ncbi:MAG: carboxymuconolactone decarboxylase family protein [Deltaproteobacteria bacterium]|nr:carboxymuconolactone decarboxylase family protein [Deltaproteobacteria bacterium]
MNALELLRASLPDEARDIKLNLSAVLQGGSGAALSQAQRWGVAVACAAATRNAALLEATLADAAAHAEAPVISDALAASVVMAMNNVFYRFRHMIGKPAYEAKPARLRMNRLGQPASRKVDFELFALAVSAMNACESCVRSHEKVVLENGLTDDHVHEAVRIAAVMQATAVALEIKARATAPVAA